MVMTYWKREALHSALAVLATTAVAVAASLASAESFDTVFWSGVAVTAVRTAGTAVVTVLTPYVLKRRRS